MASYVTGIKLWNAKVSLSFIMYELFHIQWEMSPLSNTSARNKHIAFAESPLTLPIHYPLREQWMFLTLSVWKLSFTAHLSDSSILNKQTVRWLNHLRYLRALRIWQAVMNMLEQAELFSISIWVALENAPICIQTVTKVTLTQQQSTEILLLYFQSIELCKSQDTPSWRSAIGLCWAVGQHRLG